MAYHDAGGLGYDAAGNLKGVRQDGDGGATTTTYQYTYLNGSWQQSAAVTNRGSTQVATVTQRDANGFVVGIRQPKAEAQGGTDWIMAELNRPKLNDVRYDRTFVNDASGTAVFVSQGGYNDIGEVKSSIANPASGYQGGVTGSALTPGHVQRQLVANGEVLARYGDAPTQEENTPQTNNPAYVDTADFRLQAAQIRPRHKSLDPVAYTVVGGETLKDIARNVLGDASLWWRIADANSLAVSGDGQLTAGQTLTVPKLSLNANSVETFQLYDPSQAMGSMDPVLPVPANGGDCGIVGQIIVVVVSVVVSIFAGPVIGNLAGQMMGNLVGSQNGISWKSLALSAISAGVASGVEYLSGFSGASAGWQGAAVQMGTTNLITQGIGVATGLQDRFDWRGVAASAAGAAAGNAAGSALQGATWLDGLGQTGAAWARGTLSGMAAGMTAAVARGGRVSIQQVAVDAFGNALGQQMGAAILDTGANALAGAQTQRPGGNPNQAIAQRYQAAGVDPITQAYDYMQSHPQSSMTFGNALEYYGDQAASSYLPSLIADSQMMGGGKMRNGVYQDEWSQYTDWDSGARATQVLQHGLPVGTALAPWVAPQDGFEQARTNLREQYAQIEAEATNPLAAVLGRLGRVAGEGAYDFVDGFRHLATLATDDKARRMALARGAYAVTNPGETARGVVMGGVNYLRSTSADKMGEDALRFAVGGILSAGAGKVFSAAGNMALVEEATASRLVGGVEKGTLSRGEELRQRYGHLSAEERRAIIWDRTEEIARRQLEKLEASNSGAHFMSRHSPQVDLYDQLVSAATGMRPDGKIMGGVNNRFAVDSTQFLSNKDMLYGINRAERIQQYAISTGNPINNYISLKFDYNVGEGFLKNTPLFGGDLANFYKQTKFANFGIDSTSGRAITAYPVISKSSLGIVY
ncbi:LysM peptidoglycan-binding domain-containing protein [Paracidovorax avenae]